MAGPKQSSRATNEDSPVVGDALGPQGAGGGKLGGGGADISRIAGDIADTALQQGKTLLESARGQATGFVDQRKSDAAQSIADLASTLRESGGGFEGKPSLQAFVGSAADGLEQLAGNIRDRSFAEIYGEVEDFARRQPMLVAAGAVFAGFALARFIKASADDLAETRSAARTAGAARSAAATRSRGRAAASDRG